MSGPERIRTTMFGIVLLLVVVALCWSLDAVVTEKPILKDSRQNLHAAYNICTWGVFSTNPGTAQQPSLNHYREPLPPFVTSLLLLYYTSRAHHLTDLDFEKGACARLIKRVNIFWAFFVLVGSGVLCVQVIRNRLCAFLVVLLVYACFLRNPAYMDCLLTEIPTAALMLWTAIVFISCSRRQKPLLFLAAGILLGFLTLTKALFLYIAVGIAMGLLIYFFLARAMRSSRLQPACLAFFMLGFVCTAGPWVLRNKVNFDSAAISSRGGMVLYYRALKNQMDPYEILAAFYLWGPGVYTRIVKNTFLDIGEREYEEGGRAVRLNRLSTSSFALRDRQAEAAGKPECAITLYRRARADRVRMAVRFREEGHPYPLQAADNFLKIQSVRMIAGQPIRHVLMTVPFAWRGIWCFYGGGVFTLLNALSYAAFVALCCYGVVKKNRELMLFCLLPMLMLFLYAFLTHNQTRFSAPAIPFMIISFFIAARFLANSVRAFRGRGRL